MALLPAAAPQGLGLRAPVRGKIEGFGCEGLQTLGDKQNLLSSALLRGAVSAVPTDMDQEGMVGCNARFSSLATFREGEKEFGRFVASRHKWLYRLSS